MEFKEKRNLSFLAILIIYIFASIIGLYVYKKIDAQFWIKLLVADVVSTIIVFIFSLIFNNSSVYDPYWSVQPIVIVSLLAIYKKVNLTIFLAILVVFLWGIRLTLNWAYTFKNLNQQDWRYTMLKEKTGSFYPIINFIGIHFIPTLVVYLCILPIVYLFYYQSSLNIISLIFLLLSMSAILIQGIADYEMHKFQKKKTKTLIREGLWKYSRHPNYLGEILMWWGIGLYSVINLHNYWFLICGAICNTLLFLFISIPLAENHQATRKDGYEEYKKETRLLLPFKK